MIDYIIYTYLITCSCILFILADMVYHDFKALEREVKTERAIATYYKKKYERLKNDQN